MNRTRPTGVPCLICGVRIAEWDHDDRAQPCGHTWDELADEAWAVISALPKPDGLLPSADH